MFSIKEKEQVVTEMNLNELYGNDKEITKMWLRDEKGRRMSLQQHRKKDFQLSEC